MYAGADILLMPSRYEPCGLSQLISMRYGTIPVARATGGLKDTVVNSNMGQVGTGFTFPQASGDDTAAAISRAIESYKSKLYWGKIVQNSLVQDYSWNKSAQKYCTLYQEVLAE